MSICTQAITEIAKHNICNPHQRGWSSQVQAKFFNCNFSTFFIENRSNWERRSIAQPAAHDQINASLDYLDLSLDARLDHVNHLDQQQQLKFGLNHLHHLDHLDRLDVGLDHLDDMSVFSSGGATSVQVLRNAILIIFLKLLESPGSISPS